MATGIYMALWIYAESHVATLLGAGKTNDLILGGLLLGSIAAMWLWVRLQGSLIALRRFTSVRKRRITLALSSIIIYLLFINIINNDNLLTSVLYFTLMTIYLGMVVAIGASTLYHETDFSEWGRAVSTYKTTTTLFQLLTLIMIKVWSLQDEEFIIQSFAVSFILSMISAYKIHGALFSSISLKTIDNFTNIISHLDTNYTILTHKDLMRIGSMLGSLAVAKMILLPKAISSDPLLALALYSLGYLIGARFAQYLYNMRLITILSITPLIVILLGLPYKLTLMFVGVAIGYVEVSSILIILDNRPRVISNANIIITLWVIIGSILVGLTSFNNIKYTALAGLTIAFVGLILGRRGRGILEM